MLSEFWSTAPVRFLDAAALIDRLRAAAVGLTAQDPNVQAVVLFGSLANGTATPASDVDLLVVLEDDTRRVIDRIPQYSRPFEGPGIGVQVLPWTVGELSRRLRARDPFATEILRTGRLLAGAVKSVP